MHTLGREVYLHVNDEPQFRDYDDTPLKSYTLIL